jgi:hypothetical protein
MLTIFIHLLQVDGKFYCLWALLTLLCPANDHCINSYQHVDRK